MPRLPHAFELHIQHENDRPATVLKLKLPDALARHELDNRVALERHLASKASQYDTSWKALAAQPAYMWERFGYTFHDEPNAPHIHVRANDRATPVDLERTYVVQLDGSIGVDATNETDARKRASEALASTALDTTRFDVDFYACVPTIRDRYRQYIMLSTQVTLVDNHAVPETKDLARDIALSHPGLDDFRFDSIELTRAQYRRKDGDVIGEKID